MYRDLLFQQERERHGCRSSHLPRGSARLVQFVDVHPCGRGVGLICWGASDADFGCLRYHGKCLEGNCREHDI